MNHRSWQSRKLYYMMVAFETGTHKYSELLNCMVNVRMVIQLFVVTFVYCNTSKC